MTNISKKRIVACLDIGSSKLVCLIAAIDNENITILGYGHKESKGIISSAISDMNLASKAITNVISEAERNAGLNIDRILVSISGSQIASNRKELGIKISADMVKNTDINNLANKARLELKKINREVIHLIPLQYRIDDSLPVHNPRYMWGKNLYAKFHIVSTSATTVKNIENCLKKCQLSVNNYTVEPYVCAISCLSEHEMNIGTLLIDVGGSNTSFCLMIEGKLIYIGNFAIGGIHITKDIATILNIDFNSAEKIKTLNSSLIISPKEENELIKLGILDLADGPSMIRITKLELKEIIKSRIEEIIESVKNLLDKASLPMITVSNVVLTGGVTALVGIDKIAAEILGKNVRIGYPNKIENLPAELSDPAHACAVGMLIFLKNMYLKEKIKEGFETKNNWFKKLIEKLVAV
jgi:cell division protein FtsA